ncbi:hypothetical protein GF324_07735 [bacterium]|nr:hypothetical protein [bacterium]
MAKPTDWKVFVPVLSPGLLAFAAFLKFRGIEVLVSDLNGEAREQILSFASLSAVENAEEAFQEFPSLFTFVGPDDRLPKRFVALVDEITLDLFADEAGFADDSFLDEFEDPLPEDPLDKLFDQRFLQAEWFLLHSQSEEQWDNMDGYYRLSSAGLVEVRFHPSMVVDEALELCALPGTDPRRLDKAAAWLGSTGMFITTLNYRAPGRARERIRVPVETEAWRLVKEVGVDPSLVDHLSRTMLNSKLGVLSQLHGLNPGLRAEITDSLAQGTYGDVRFRPTNEPYPLRGNSRVWAALNQAPKPLQAGPVDRPERILLCGTPQLVQGWKQRLTECTEGSVRIHDRQIYELGEINEDTMSELAGEGPFDLILECQLGTHEIRQYLVELLSGVLAEGGQMWVHTLTSPASIPVGVLPQDLSAVGFSGLPPLWDAPVVELSQPASGPSEDLDRAAAVAAALGLQPYDVPDEPGAVIPRLLAMLVNATAFLYREGIVSSPAAADRVARHGFAMPAGPFRIADTVGLDVIEAVLASLQALYGEERYRVCPDIVLRIEAGMVGKITGRGYYVT